MRKQRMLAVLSAVFTALLLTNLLLWQAGGREMPTDSDGEITITDISVSDIGGAAVKNSTGSYGMIRERDMLTMMDEPDISWSIRKMNAFVYYFSHMKAVRIMDGEQDLTEYGLDPAESVITLLLTDGSKIRLSLGKANPMDGAYYFQREGDHHIYLVEAMAATLAGQSMDDFRDMRLFPELDEVGLNRLTRITVRQGDSAWVMERTGEQGTSYRLCQPVEADLNWELADRLVIAPLQSLVPETFVSSDKPLTDYGLDSPDGILELTIGGKEYRIGFSESGEDTFYCAELSGQTVYEVKSEQAEFMKTGYTMLLGDSVYTRNIAEISNLTLTDGSIRYSLDVKGEGENLSGNLNGKRLDYLEMVRFYKNISQIPIAEEVPEEETINSEPLMSMTMQLRDGGMDAVLFFPAAGSERQCAVSLNGQIRFTTYRSVIEDLLSAFRRESE